MNKQRKLILAAVAFVVVFAAAFGLSFAGREQDSPEANKVELASLAERDQQACASGPVYGQLKRVLFEDAAKIGNSDPANLDVLATNSVVRMENPVVKSRDSASNITVCSGRFVLELPPGAERAFAGQRRLTADINYTARPAADGSGLVYEIMGAERILAQVADFDLKGQPFVPSGQQDVQFADAGALPAMGGPLEPVEEEVPQAAPPPLMAETVRAEPRRQPQPRAAEPVRERETRRERTREVRLARAETAQEIRQKARAERARRTEREAARPSFNCRHAKTRSERMVCDSSRLASRDRQMSRQFYSALDDADRRTRRELQRTRDRFLAYRERCRSEECVADAYEGRMREIDDIMAAR